MEMKQNDLNNRASKTNNSSRRPSLNQQRSICIPDNQMQLLTSLKKRHFLTFKKIITSTAVNVNYCYDYPDYKTCLEIACCDHTPKFVDLLLRHGADPNIRNPHHNRAALHFAIERADVEIVKLLLKVDNIDVNVLSNGNTPLVKLVKQIEEDEDNMDKYIKCCELLLKANADVNIPDANGKSAIYLAVLNKYGKIVELILDSKMDVDIDSYKDRCGKCVRDLIYMSNIYTKPLPEYSDKRKAIILQEKMMLIRMLHQEDEEQFVETLKNFITSTGVGVVNLDNNVETLLQVACRKGLEKCVKKLLLKGADVNMTGPDNPHHPIEIICSKGYFGILSLMLEHDKIHVPHTILHTVVKCINNKIYSPKSDYKICLDLLLGDSRINVNMTDNKNNTALHYAVRYSDHDSIMKLLGAGACISLRNSFKQPPLADIPPKTLHSFLDECLQTNDERCVDDNFEIRFNYDFLIPPSNLANCVDNQCSIPVEDDDKADIRNNNDCYLAPETDALLYMSQNPELRPLLKHPVMTSFLFLKWQRISWLFYTNMTFYSMFCLLLIGYILIGYGPNDRPDVIHELVPEILHFMLVVMWIMLMLRELFQFVVSPKTYLKNFENLLEITLILVTLSVVLYEPEEYIRQQISAVAILLSATEFLLLIGQHPLISTNIVMLRTVSWNFFKFLCWYSILIVAFALSFYTLFRENDSLNTNTTVPVTNGDSEEEPNFFTDPGISLFKTILMLTGEFEAGSIKFKTFPVTSHLIFVMFVFLIAIVLFNLLNGLAVSDTALIKQDAELVGYVSRIQLISYFEAMLLGETPPFARFLQNICCCCSLNARNMFCLRPVAERICLFPNYLPQAKIAIKPNLGRKIIFKLEKKCLDYETQTRFGCCLFSWCKDIEMDRKVIKAAKVVISEKKNVSELDDIRERLDKLQQIVAQCEQYIHKQDNNLQDVSKALINITNIISKS